MKSEGSSKNWAKTATGIALVVLVAALGHCSAAAQVRTMTSANRTRLALPVQSVYPTPASLSRLSPKFRNQVLEFIQPPPAQETWLGAWYGTFSVNPMTGKGPSAQPGPFSIDWEMKTGMTWTFRWTTQQPGAKTAVYQIARYPFSPVRSAWNKTTGLVKSGATALAEQTTTGGAVFHGNDFVIDFNPIAPRPPDWPVAAVAMQYLAGPNAVSPTIGSIPPPATAPRDARIAAGAIRAARAPITLPVSYTLYVRVVTLDGNGKPIGRPSNTVAFNFVPIMKVDQKKYLAFLPTISLIDYRPAHTYMLDWQCRALCTTKDPLMGCNSVNQSIYICGSGSSGPFSDFVEAATSPFEALGELIEKGANWLHDAYQSIKNEALTFAADHIPGGCGGLCREVLEGAMNTALLSIGVPPDLPDFDQLQSMGAGYMAKCLVEAAGADQIPLSDSLAKEMIQKVIDEGKAKSNASGSNGLWKQDPEATYQPLMLTYLVRNETSFPTKATSMSISQQTAGVPGYWPHSAHIPSLNPGESIKIAVQLTPSDDPAGWMALMPKSNDFLNLDVYQKKLDAATAARKLWCNEHINDPLTFRAAICAPSGYIWPTVTATCYAKYQVPNHYLGTFQVQ